MLVEWQIRRELDSEYTDVIWLGKWAAPSVKARPQPGIFDKLCLVPVHINSVLSMLSLSWLAAIHCSIAVTHCWTLATANCTFSGLQCMYSWLSSANAGNVKLYFAAMSAKSAMYRNNNGPRTEPCGTEHMTWMTWRWEATPLMTTQ